MADNAARSAVPAAGTECARLEAQEARNEGGLMLIQDQAMSKACVARFTAR